MKPHIVADSAFGSLALLEKIRNWGGTATLAFNEIQRSWLWYLLNYKVSFKIIL